MTLLPVVERELRAAARQPFTYTLRVVGALALLVVLMLSALEGGLRPDEGGQLFGVLHATLFLAIWLLVPLLTADCISRERREGTLPLLFLTPLKPSAIVWAKGIAQGWRGFTLWVAVLPVLAIPFIAGGVSWPEVVLSVLTNFSSICLAIAAGLVASAWSRVGNRALAAAVCLAIIFFLGFVLAVPFFVALVPGTGAGGLFEFWVELSFPDVLAATANWEGAWGRFLSSAPRGPVPVIAAFAIAGLCSLVTLSLLVRFAAWKVKRTWRDPPPSARVLWLKDKLLRPILLQSLLRRWLQWELQRNPIGWLERRSSIGRAVVWSWFAIVVCLYSWLLANLRLFREEFHGLQVSLAWLLTGSITLSAAGSFRRERETGVLELLLVSPLREWQLIGGRLRGLWSQFMPATLFLCGIWLYCATFVAEQTRDEVQTVLSFAAILFTVPIVGLYFSLVRRTFLAAVIWTFLCEVAAPFAMAWSLDLCLGRYSPINPQPGPHLAVLLLPVAYQTFAAVAFGWLLHENLKRRRFALAG